MLIAMLHCLFVVLGAKCGVLWQDLPEFFEDNMATWMTHFQTLLSTNNPLLISAVIVSTALRKYDCHLGLLWIDHLTPALSH